ncbi:MAG: hypothetical protein CMJ49_14410, partial [Planctomycetaceae bacterium]|nr:hypothetical protein [Planctomycetaceae bacterium]
MLTLCVLFAATLTGCATYVNIPAQQGDFASHNPNDWTVRRVTAAALTHLLTNADAGQPVDGPYA